MQIAEAWRAKLACGPERNSITRTLKGSLVIARNSENWKRDCDISHDLSALQLPRCTRSSTELVAYSTVEDRQVMAAKVGTAPGRQVQGLLVGQHALCLS